MGGWGQKMDDLQCFRFSKISVECSVHLCSCPCSIALGHFVVFSEYLNLKFPNGPVNNFQEVFNDPQVLHNEMVQTVTDETFGEIKQVIHNDTVGSNAL